MDASGKHSRAHQEILYALLCDSFEPLAHFINSFGEAPTPSAPPRLPPLSLANPIRPLPPPSIWARPGVGGRAKTEKMATRVFLSGGLLRQGRARAWSAIFCCLLHRGLTGTFSRALLITSKRFHATISCNGSKHTQDTKN